MSPRVSFLLPVYNEQEHLGEALDSIADQEYPLDDMEIVVAEGRSTDGTRRVLDEFHKRWPELALKVIDNPSRNTSIGRNLCLEHATGELVMNFSGHAVAEPRMLRILVDKLLRLSENVAGVGCAIRATAANTPVALAVATVLDSPLGGGGSMDSSFRAAQDRFARSLAFCLYRRSAVDQAGGFDPNFWCGQDAELNLRLARAGLKLLFTPETNVLHYKRRTLKSFGRQMYLYGLARAMIVRKFPNSLRPVFLLPALWVACLLLVAVASWFSGIVALASLLAAGIFVLASAATTAMSRGSLGSMLLSPLILGLLYTSYGLGFWRGMLRLRKTNHRDTEARRRKEAK